MVTELSYELVSENSAVTSVSIHNLTFNFHHVRKLWNKMLTKNLNLCAILNIVFMMLYLLINECYLYNQDLREIEKVLNANKPVSLNGIGTLEVRKLQIGVGVVF